MNKLMAATDTLKELAAIYLCMITASALLFMQLEGGTLSDAFYWAGTTATSTGYGDLSPKSVPGRLLALALMHASIFVVAPMIIVRLIDRLNVDRDAFTHEEQAHIAVAIERVEARLTAIEQRIAAARPQE
jgi:voltage-gated potassium channel